MSASVCVAARLASTAKPIDDASYCAVFEQAGGEADDGDASYHLTLTATEVFPTGVIRVIYSPTAAPGGSHRPHRRRSTRNTG
jgi:hypothetical protein